MDLKERLLDFLLPRSCGACQEHLPAPMSGPLCGACLKALRPLEGPLCRRCSAPSPGTDFCRSCRGRSFAVERVAAAFPYRGPARPLLHAFKYRGLLPHGRALADWMAGAYGLHPELKDACAVAPVPLHPARLRRRGFNQAEVLARAVARAAKLPVLAALRRTRWTAPQWLLGRAARRRNLRAAFGAEPGLDLAGRTVLLVDDVCTTGGTLEACGRALKAAGAARVLAYVLARD